MYLFQKGQTIDNRYTVVFPHKKGAYAETYRVRDTSGKLRFLKLIYYSKLQYSQFDKDGCIIELEVTKQLNHPNVCKYVDSGKLIANGQQLAYIVTEFVSGETLDRHIARQGNISVYDIKQIAKALLSALQYLHSQASPIIHNEVTIQNLMLDLSGTLENMKLIDFGHARFLNQEPAKPNLKQLNPFYMAPERLNGVSCVQSDLFSVGVILYQLLFSRLPWFFDMSGMSNLQIVERIQEERENPLKIPNITKFELDDQLLNIVDKATQTEVQDRFQSAQEMKDAIEGRIRVVGTHKVITAPSEPPCKKNVKHGNGFADVAGMKELKEQLQSDVIELLQHPELAVMDNQLPNGMLFYGPPGCGKTFFAEKFAEEAGFNYQYVKTSDVASPYIHGGQKLIAELFEEAKRNAPTILFFDEIDSMITKRQKQNNVSEQGEVAEFLAQLNNCGSHRVFVIGATNRPQEIDEAALRAGRLELHYYIPQPDFETRKEIFEVTLKKARTDFGIDFDRLASLTENYVSADITEKVVKTAARLATRRRIGKITMELLEEAIRISKPSLTTEQIRQHEAIRDGFLGIKSQRPTIGFTYKKN